MPPPTLVDRVLEWCRAELEADVREATGHNDGLPATRYCGGREEPWCAHAMATAFRECGHPLPGDVVPTMHRANPIASVMRMEQEMGARGWLVQTPMRGDLVFFAHRNGSDKSVTGRHVGIIERVALTTVTTLEANVPTCWRRITYRRAGLDASVTSFGRMPEPGDGQPPPLATTGRVS
jgi:hypothetical protein